MRGLTFNRLFFLSIFFAFCLNPVQAFQTIAPRAYASIDIRNLGHSGLRHLQNLETLEWWIELGDRLLVLTDLTTLKGLAADFEMIRFPVKVAEERLFLVKQAHNNDLDRLKGTVLGRGGRFAVVQLAQGRNPRLLGARLGDGSLDHPNHGVLLPFTPHLVLARQRANERREAPAKRRAVVADLVARVDGMRWFRDLFKLHCFHRDARDSGLGQATSWLVEQFQAMDGLQVSTQPFDFGSIQAENVIAVLEGSQNPDDWYLIGAHYDAIAQSRELKAPGAEDNASGTAAVLEMARIFSQHRPHATLIFICYSGEEQGLLGSRHHVDELFANGDQTKVRAMLNMDMIAYTSDDDLDVLLESGDIGADLIDRFANAAATYTDLRVLTSFNPFGSDHIPYLNEDIPAILIIENEWNRYPDYHRTTDVSDNLGLEMATETLKMCVAAMAEMVGIDP